jgi:hypothetical protein
MGASPRQCPSGEQLRRYSSVTVCRGVCLTHERRHKNEREGTPSLNTEVRRCFRSARPPAHPGHAFRRCKAHSRPYTEEAPREPPVALVSKGRRSITSTVGFRPTTPLCQAVGANRAEPWSAPPSRWTVGILDPNWTVWAVTAPAWFRRYSGEHADWKLGQTWGQEAVKKWFFWIILRWRVCSSQPGPDC